MTPGVPTPTADEARLRQWRGVVTPAFLAAVFVQAVLAGVMMSGAAWARTAHSAMAGILIAGALGTALAAFANFRQVRQGVRLAWTLLALGAVLALQASLGALSAKGVNLLWAHIPLGVALVGFATHAVVAAETRRSA
jgi:hypothetical protein